jgi:hypothetical protein
MREAQSQDSAMVVALGGALLSSAAGKLGDEGARPFRSCVLVAFNLALRVLLLRPCGIEPRLTCIAAEARSLWH